jgi:hypothetical protein
VLGDGTPTYRIARWDETFENAASRKLKELNWVAIPTRHDTRGYRRVIGHERGAEIYAAWCLMVQVAARLDVRGILESHGEPLTAADLALKTGAKEEIFTLAFEVLSRPEIGWTLADSPETLADSPETLADSPETLADSPATDRPTRTDTTTGQTKSVPEKRPGFAPQVLPGRAGKPNDAAWRNLFVIQVCEAMGLGSNGALAQRRSMIAVASRLVARPDRDASLARCVAIAREMVSAGMDSRPAAWQARINHEFPK